MIIYLVTNLINNKQYIGQTTQDLHRRWQAHQCKGHALYYAIKKHGIDNFSIEQIDVALTQEELDIKEKNCIKKT